MDRLLRILPTLVLAAGVLGGTALAVMAQQSRPALMPVGPLVVSASILLAKFIELKWLGVAGGWKRALSMAAICFVAGMAVTYVSPKWIGQVVAVFGGASFTVLSEPLRCFVRRKPAARERTA